MEPMKLMLKSPGSKRLKLQYNKPLSSSAFKFNLRRYTKVTPKGGVKLPAPKLDSEDEQAAKKAKTAAEVGRCRLKPAETRVETALVS